MNKKWIPYLVILLLALALFFIKRWQDTKGPVPQPKTVSDKDPSKKPSERGRGFDRRVEYLQYSGHAKCRMQCRMISRAEVEEIMREGKINYNKSDLKNARCPRYALEGITSDDQRVRIVYAQCNEFTTVVTVIDLSRDWSCECPGDDDKYKNRNWR